MRLEFAASVEEFAQIAAEAAATPNPDVFLRDLAARAHAALAARGRCEGYGAARAIWSAWPIPYAKRMMAELETGARNCVER